MTDPPWQPDWELAPAPAGDDEDQVRELYESLPEITPPRLPWGELADWVRESWRREYRDA